MEEGQADEKITIEDEFQLADGDHDGRINAKELKNLLLKAINFGPEEEDCKGYIDQVAPKSNGTIDYDQFITIASSLQEQLQNNEEGQEEEEEQLPSPDGTKNIVEEPAVKEESDVKLKESVVKEEVVVKDKPEAKGEPEKNQELKKNEAPDVAGAFLEQIKNEVPVAPEEKDQVESKKEEKVVENADNNKPDSKIEILPVEEKKIELQEEIKKEDKINEKPVENGDFNEIEDHIKALAEKLSNTFPSFNKYYEEEENSIELNRVLEHIKGKPDAYFKRTSPSKDKVDSPPKGGLVYGAPEYKYSPKEHRYDQKNLEDSAAYLKKELEANRKKYEQDAQRHAADTRTPYSISGPALPDTYKYKKKGY